jgi:LysR family hydrogen peroxide-inducible transcriptional activator
MPSCSRCQRRATGARGGRGPPRTAGGRDLDLLLLEDGDWLRDQALKVRANVDPRRLSSYGAASLTTIVQPVAKGQGVTLLPELFIDVEGAADPRVRLLRFTDPEPKREVGLVWRRSSPRRADIEALGEGVRACRAAVR